MQLQIICNKILHCNPTAVRLSAVRVTLAPEHYHSVIAGLDPVIYNSLFRNNFLRRDGS
jgi:hypothetical protein